MSVPVATPVATGGRPPVMQTARGVNPSPAPAVRPHTAPAAPSPPAATPAGGPDPREHPLVKDVIELFQARVIDVQRKEGGE